MDKRYIKTGVYICIRVASIVYTNKEGRTVKEKCFDVEEAKRVAITIKLGQQ